MSGDEELLAAFETFSGATPEGRWAAPGRVNLIGEHTDYNDGLSLPFAIDRKTVVAARRRPDRRIRARSLQVNQQLDTDIDGLAPGGDLPEWSRYVAGIAWVFARRGVEVPGVDLVLSSGVPVGSGLSSSASIEAAVAVALNDLAGAGLDEDELIVACHESESTFVGVPCGFLDQTAVIAGREGHGVLIDFARHHHELLPLHLGPVVVINTRVKHHNGDGTYARRRQVCEAAARSLGLSSLREATADDVNDRLSGEEQARARHVVSENARVVEAAARLRAGQPIADLLFASHRSLRDDYEVSCPELDLAVDTAEAAGAGGARLTGAGLGGCAIAIGVDEDRLRPALEDAFAEAGFATPEVFSVLPSAGAHRLD